MERSNGEERTESKCRKDKNYDLRYGTGPPAEFRRVSMHRLSHWSGQQQHLSDVQSAMLHASETWPLTKPNLQHLQRNDRAMIRQICNVRPQDIVTTRSNELLVRLGIEDLDLILKERRLRWYGHVERFNGAVQDSL